MNKLGLLYYLENHFSFYISMLCASDAGTLKT
jgi:hypothetical protein